MNAEAILTPGGIADQLTRGLSGLGQAFVRGDELRYQGQRDRVADDRYSAEAALREREMQRRDARQALEDQRYQDETAYRRDQDQRVAADRELARQAAYPELYQGSPSPQIASRATDALRRREFDDASKGYVSPEKMQVLPDQQDWRVPMAPGERMYGPPASSPAAQGLAARETRTRAPRDHMAEKQLGIDAATERQTRELEAKDKAARLKYVTKRLADLEQDQNGAFVPEASNWVGRQFGGLSQEQVNAHPSTLKYNQRDQEIKELKAELETLQGGGAAGALGRPTVAPAQGTDDWAPPDARQFIHRN